MRLFLTIIFLLHCLFLKSETDTTHYIQVHFLYGSKPLKKYKKSEVPYFGGIHGGHVSIQIDSVDYGFSPAGKVHIFSHNKHHSVYHGRETHHQNVYPTGYKVETVIIPITLAQYNQLNAIVNDYCSKAPYDYAFFGMRCASSAQDVLSQIGIVKKRRQFRNIATTFYPKKLRQRLIKLAKQKQYKIINQEGRPTRKWERD
jgi:hypothetical protein